MADIGVKKPRMGVNIVLILIFISTALIYTIMWGNYQANYSKEYLIENGVETDAVGVEWFVIYATNSSNPSESLDAGYYCRYKYIGLDGEEHFVSINWLHKKTAMAQIGKTITIVIDPRDNKVSHVNLKSLKLTYERDFILAILFCFPVPIAAYFLLYRGIYRSAINYKISKKVGENEPDFMGGKHYNTYVIKVGEVTKVKKWIVCYVKVKYQDENGVVREKWAQSWFTHKEAKFLQNKKNITLCLTKTPRGF